MDGMIYASEEEAQAAHEEDKKKKEEQRKRDLVTQARERFSAAEEAETEVRKKADEDIRFRAGEQWDAAILNARKMDGRPALVINRIPQFERQITNEQRQARPSINVSPVDSGADVETAEVLQGLIRHIEYDSGADVAYDTALTSAVRGGLGYVRLVTEYEGEDSFEQAIKIKRVRDPFSVYFDPNHQEQDGSDANWAFVVDDGISKEEFEAEYPDAKPVDGGWGNRQSANGHGCQVVEYFYRERVKDELLQLQPVEMQPTMMMDPQSGQPMQGEPHPVPSGEPISVLKSAADAEPERFASMMMVSSRPTHRIKVCWCKIAGDTVIEEREFPSKWLPIVPVLGDELWVGGKRILEGIVRHAKDPQRMVNFWSSAITETIAIAPRAPWIGAEGQFEGYEKEWAEAAVRNKAFLQYRPKTIGGSLAPPPQRNAFEAPIAAMSNALGMAQEDMKGTTGIYDASLGNRSNETSGLAIARRTQQSQTATVHFSDNLARAIRHLGRIIIDAIPYVYSGTRVVRILGEDRSEKLVTVNGQPKDESQTRPFDLGAGKYDVSVSMGPSYTSKRQEAVATQMEFMRAYPNAAPVIGDMLAENMDWPGAKKMAKRLRKMLPPNLQEPEEGQKLDPAALAQQLQQSQHMIEQLTQAVHQAHDALETRAVERQSEERKDLIAKHVDLAKAFASAAPEDITGRSVILREMQTIEARLGLFQPVPEASLQPGGTQ